MCDVLAIYGFHEALAFGSPDLRMPASISGANLYDPQPPSPARIPPARGRSRALKGGERPTSMPRPQRPARMAMPARGIPRSGQLQPLKSGSWRSWKPPKPTLRVSCRNGSMLAPVMQSLHQRHTRSPRSSRMSSVTERWSNGMTPRGRCPFT